VISGMLREDSSLFRNFSLDNLLTFIYSGVADQKSHNIDNKQDRQHNSEFYLISPRPDQACDFPFLLIGNLELFLIEQRKTRQNGRRAGTI
jgi:hypothetical protein